MATTPYSGTTIENAHLLSYGNGATEIIKADGALLVSTNSGTNSVDVISLLSGEKLSLNAVEMAGSVNLEGLIGGITSVDIKGSTIVAAHTAAALGTPGFLVVYDGSGYDGTLASIDTTIIHVGVHPDSVVLSADGKTAYLANEGEVWMDADGTSVDPRGSISAVNLETNAITTIEFDGFTTADLEDIRIAPTPITLFGSRTEAAKYDIEPEYVTLSPDGETLFVSLQEANAVAKVDLTAFTIGNHVVGADVMTLLPLGTKDHSVAGAGLDVSDRDDVQTLTTQPVKGLYMPDAIASFEKDGVTYFVTANEGDTRDPEEKGDAYGDESRVKDANLDSALAATLDLTDTGIGRLTISTIDGDTDGDGDLDELYSFGARSFSIWSEDGALVYDSGDDLDALMNEYFPTEALALLEGRADNKGSEPEALELLTYDGSMFLAVGMERADEVAIFNIDDPTAPVFEMFLDNLDTDVSPEEIEVTVVGGATYILSANEVSGTISISSITAL